MYKFFITILLYFLSICLYSIDYDRFFLKSVIQQDDNTAINLIKQDKVSLYTTFTVSLPLLERLKKSKTSQVNILELAVIYGNYELLKYLLKMGADQKLSQKSILSFKELAFLYGHFDLCKELLNKEIVKEGDKNLLKYAKILNKKEIIELLIPVQKQKLTKEKLIELKSISKQIKKLTQLIIHHKKQTQALNEKFYSYVSSLRNKNDKKAILILKNYHLKNRSFKLLTVYSRLNIEDPKGRKIIANTIFSNTFIISVYFQNIKLIKYHLNGNYDINIVDGFNSHSLHYAVVKNNFTITKLLIENGIDINKQNKWGNTPLHIAVGNNQFKITEYLINKGADVNIKSKDGLIPLHYSCALGNLKITKLLIKNNADITIKDKLGKTPLDYAVERKRSKIIQFFKEKVK